MTGVTARSAKNGDDGAVTSVLAVPSYQDGVASIAQTTVGPPMGIAYLAAVLEAAAEPVALLDANAEALGPAPAATRILAERPSFVGFTASTPTIGRCAAIAQELRRCGYAGPLGVGGPHPSALPRETLRDFPVFDVAAAGEAEGRIVALVRAMRGGEEPLSLPGLAFFRGEEIVWTGPAPPPPDVDSIPHPARHLLPQDRYRSPDSLRAQTVVATRGCPAPCSYCAVPGMFGRAVRRRAPEDVADEVLRLVVDGADWVNFVDDTFTWDAAWVTALCDAFVARGLPERLGWQCLTRVDRVDEALLTALRGAGCRRIELGIECGTRQGLRRLRKRVSRRQIVTAFDAAHAAGLETMALAMVNAPGEGRAGVRATWRLIRRLDPDQLQVSVCTPYPGTRLYDEAVQDGALRTRDWARYSFLRSAVFDNGSLSEHDALEAQRLLQWRFWARPRVIVRLSRRVLREPRARRAVISTAAVGARRLLSRGR